jgi:hypothetical protein
MLVVAEKGVVLLLGIVVSVRVACSRSVSRGVDRPVGLSVIPSPRVAAWSAATGRGRSGSIKRDDSPGGSHDPHDPHPTAVGVDSCAAGMQAADFSVAQPVEDQFDEFAGGGDFADVCSAACTDVVADSA